MFKPFTKFFVRSQTFNEIWGEKMPQSRIGNFFCEVGPCWDLRTQAHWPIALSLSFKFIWGYLGVQPPYRGPWSHSASLAFIESIMAKPKVCILNFSNTGQPHRMCTDVSFSAPHLLHKGVFALLILCSIYCRLICPVKSPTILQCFLSSSLMNWAYLSVGSSRHSWLVPYLSQTLHSVYFLFSIKFIILELNLLQNSGRKGCAQLYKNCPRSKIELMCQLIGAHNRDRTKFSYD